MSAGLAGGAGSWPSPSAGSRVWNLVQEVLLSPFSKFPNPYQQRLPEDLLSGAWKNSAFCGQPVAVCTVSVEVCADRPGQRRPRQRRACVPAEQSRRGQRLASSATPWPGSEAPPSSRALSPEHGGLRRPLGRRPPPLLLHSPETVPPGPSPPLPGSCPC